MTERIRKRPSTTKKRAQPIQQIFAESPVLRLLVPSVTADYNDLMGAVDIGDQLRATATGGTQHRVRRGGWQAIAWSFLLETALVNSYLLQRHGQPSWKPYKGQRQWRQQLVDELFQRYSTDGASRQRFRAGDTFTPFLQHNHVDRKKRGLCFGCQGFRVGEVRSRSQQRTVLGARGANSLNGKPRQTTKGCDKCNVALCTLGNCWYFYHRQNPPTN